MSERDKWDELAEQSIPCDMIHDSRCPCRYRWAVAAELRKQSERIEQLEHELTVIGDMAVVDFDDAVVGRVDRAVPIIPKTYKQQRQRELDYARTAGELLHAVGRLLAREDEAFRLANAELLDAYEAMKEQVDETEYTKVTNSVDP